MRMRAAVLEQMELPRPYARSRPLRIAEVELAPPEEGEVLVRVAAAGLCHSDLSVVNGDRPRPLPIVLGHEGAGVVEAVGPGVHDLAPGQPVVLLYVASCGRCATCLEGRPVLCETAFRANSAGTLLRGGRRLSRNGTPLHHHMGLSVFAEYAVVAREAVVPIDPELPLEQAALFGCAVLTGVGAVLNTAGVRPGQTVAVVGLGGVGLNAVMGARLAGARRIVAIDRLEAKLALARQLGATDTVNAEEAEAAAKVRELTEGGVDAAIEAVGSVPALELAYAVTRRGGVTVTAGIAHPERRISLQQVSLVAEERTLKGSYMGSCVPLRDVPRYIALFREGRLRVDALLCERIGFDELNEALDRLAEGRTVRQILLPHG